MAHSNKKTVIQKKDKNLSVYVIGLVLLVVAGLITLTFLYANRSKHGIKPVSDAASGGNPALPGKTIDNSKPAATTPQTPDKTTTPSGDKTDGAPATPITASISSSHQEDNGDLVIQTQIHGIGVGTCELSIYDYNGAHQGTEATVNKTADLLFQPDYSTCTGFVIPASEFGRSGQWQANLKIKNSGGDVVATATHSVIVNK